MKKNLLLVIACLLIAWSTNASATWTQKKDFGGGIRYGAVAFSIGNKGYTGMGASTATFFNDFWEYDPANNIWTQKVSLPAAGRMWGTGFSIGTKGYMGLGVWYGGYYKDFYEYDPTGNAWTKKADLAALGTGRDQAVGFSIGSKGYVGTGRNSSGKDFWEYDPSIDTWTQKAAFGGSARIDAVGFSLGSKGYIGTGWATGPTADFWEYDPAGDTIGGTPWTQKTGLPGAARSFAVGFSIGTQGFIGLGSDETNLQYIQYYQDFWQYDQATDTWTPAIDFPGMAREAAAGFAIGNIGYVGPGIYNGFSGTGNATYQKDLWEYADGTLTASADIRATQNTASVYPNPSNGHFTLSYHISSNENVLRIFDMSGKLIYYENIPGLKGAQPVNASDLSNGKYIWQITSGNQVLSTGQMVINK